MEGGLEASHRLLLEDVAGEEEEGCEGEDCGVVLAGWDLRGRGGVVFGLRGDLPTQEEMVMVT